ncbi:MAG: MogA/MoaB family molybdenum cofactor biosynthesis protein [Chloroflexi bacterium]|nr:MAG: MogA/MoaB family molybdenum cofactor biosynthesis protein [Chloroflexota bacterium]
MDAVKAVVITVSDSRHAGQNPDQSGPAVASLLRKAGYELAPVTIVPDERDQIGAAIKDAVVAGYALIVTTGGTGLGPRDVTPEATAAVLDFEVPGLAEAMRAAGLQKTPLAALSRAVAGVRGGSLIVNLPGSVRGATESLEAVLPALEHAVRLTRGETAH